MQFSKFSYLSFELTGQHSANSIIILPFHFLGICGIASTNGVRLEGIVSGDGVHWRRTCGGGVAIALLAGTSGGIVPMLLREPGLADLRFRFGGGAVVTVTDGTNE